MGTFFYLGLLIALWQSLRQHHAPQFLHPGLAVLRHVARLRHRPGASHHPSHRRPTCSLPFSSNGHDKIERVGGFASGAWRLAY